MSIPSFVEAARGPDRAPEAAYGDLAAQDRPRRPGKRLFDIALAVPLCALALPLLMVLGSLVRLTSRGPALHWSLRVGRGNRLFRMPKLRSMREHAPQLATHLMTDAGTHLTPIGGFLRRTSLDELPQLFSILSGELSFVGPRPALFNQDDLIEARTVLGIHGLVPGLTGWAQVKVRDNPGLEEKLRFDAEYLQRQSFSFDLRILAMSVRTVLLRAGIRH
jgi:O-antigen biosynthesis protein WbqP